MNDVQFEEQQAFRWFVYAVVIVGLAGTVIGIEAALHLTGVGAEAGAIWWLHLWIVFPLAFGFNFLHMRTRVLGDELYVQFGYLFPIYRKRIPLKDIVEARIVEYRPLRDAGGWGIRFGRFEGAPCRFLNCRGRRGVLVQTQERSYIIGSQIPVQLHAALEEARRKQAGSSTG